MTTVYITKTSTEPYGFVKRIAAKKYNIEENTIVLSLGVNGKPYFENLNNFHFNISHSSEMQVIAVSDSDIGIDIERLKNARLSVIKLFCKDECDYILEKDTNYRFFEVWTKKEAYLKYKGTGLSGGLNNFSVLSNSLNFKTFKKDNYLISVCGDTNLEIIDLI